MGTTTAPDAALPATPGYSTSSARADTARSGKMKSKNGRGKVKPKL